jgi:FkbH-like protein
MIDFLSIKKNLKKGTSSFPSLSIVVMGDTPTQLLCLALKGMGIEYSLNLNVLELAYNQIDHIIHSDELDQFKKYDAIIIFESTHKLLQKYNKRNLHERTSFATDILTGTRRLINILRCKTKTSIIYCNFVEQDDCVYGQYSNKVEDSFLFQLRKINYLLQEFSLVTDGLYICDLSSIQNMLGRERFWDAALYANTDIVTSLDALPYFADSVVKILLTLIGQIKKCIILDLDNTIWGGVIGDDGIENVQIGNLGIGKAFSEFQFWLKKMQQRGVILAVCSKNTEEIAKAPFISHPDMVLRLSDIALFVANWDSKCDNIKIIQRKLNIGFDSIVFLDDNPFEREIVRSNIPKITVPELPEDPALYLDYLCSLNLFETVSSAREDISRTVYYQNQESFNTFSESFSDTNEFLGSINMYSEVRPFNNFSIPRVAQLSQRSNQFNFTTIRYTEEQLKAIAESEDCFTLSFTLEDKFGDNGLVSAVVLKKRDVATLFIESWFMSCRVFKRGLEDFVMNSIMNLAHSSGFETVIGEYIPTHKNEIIKNLFQDLGFQEVNDSLWKCNVFEYSTRKNYIKLKED